MRSLWIIFRRELTQYFTSPVAYLIAFAVLLMGGFLFNSDLAARNRHAATSGVVILTYYAQFTLFFAPLLTMRLLAEEKREGTLELLMTLPVRDSDLVLGKFLGAWGYYSVLLGLTFVYQAVLYWLSPTDIGTVFSAYIGLWLYGGAAIAIGIVFSALNENQIVAAFLSMAALLLLWQADLVGTAINNRDVAVFVRTFSLQTHYMYSFAIGLIRLDDIVFFIGVITVATFVTVQIVVSRRWR